MELAALRGRVFFTEGLTGQTGLFLYLFKKNVYFSPTAFRCSAKNEVRHEREFVLQLPVIPL